MNDALRRRIPFLPPPHRLLLSAHVAGLNEKTMQHVFQAIRSFEDFNRGNDPYKEHDYGVIDFEGKQYVWKFDYYDDDFQFFKENGNRALVLMEASEY